MIYQALAFADECFERWQHLLDRNGHPDDIMAPTVTTDPVDGLEAAGIKTGFVR